MDDSDDVGEEEKALYDEEGEKGEEDEEQDVSEVDKAKDEEQEERKDSKVDEETDEDKEHMSSDIDDTDEKSDASVSTNVHPKAKKQSSDNILKYAKKSAHNQGNVEDVMFKNLFSGDLKLKIAENVNKSSKTNSIGVYITGTFCNSITPKSHWVQFMEIMEMHGCSNLNSFVATYQLYCLVIDKALLTLITATLMMTFTFAKMNSALKVYGGADPALQDKEQDHPQDFICLFL